MKIIKAIHIEGTDEKSRFWAVPENIDFSAIEEGSIVTVETKYGNKKVKVERVFENKAEHENRVLYHGKVKVVKKNVISL